MSRTAIITMGLMSGIVTCLAADPAQQPDERNPVKYGTPDKEFAQRIKGITPASSVVICKNQAIPAGWVIIAQTTNFACSTDLNNAYVIKLPDATEVVCSYSPIPQGYVITGTTTNFACSTDINNAWLIRRL
jgi:hypothetical protein